jgi:hypothetical protein
MKATSRTIYEAEQFTGEPLRDIPHQEFFLYDENARTLTIVDPYDYKHWQPEYGDYEISPDTLTVNVGDWVVVYTNSDPVDYDSYHVLADPVFHEEFSTTFTLD